MSLFKDKELAATIYLPADDNTTKITKWSSYGVDIKINILRMGFSEGIIEGVNMPEYRANLRGINYDQAARGALIKITSTNEIYQIENEPRPNVLFGGVKVDLKKYKGIPNILDLVPIELNQGGYLLY